MESVTVSPKYQVVIPKEIREISGIKPGQKIIPVYYDGRIELILDEDISQAEGFLKGIDTNIEREPDRL